MSKQDFVLKIATEPPARILRWIFYRKTWYEEYKGV